MPRSSAETLAFAVSLLVADRDVTDTLARVLRECVAQLGARAAGLMVHNEAGEFELLSATSHGVAELELFQIQNDAGPCVDAIRAGTHVVVADPQEAARRWPGAVAEAIEAAGFAGAHAAPLRWHERTLGAINVFYSEVHRADEDETRLVQAFADIACLAILQTPYLTREEVAARIRVAFQGRTLVEYAKGVIAYQRGVDMATAYEWLLGSVTEDRTLSAIATEVVEGARTRPAGGAGTSGTGSPAQ